MTGKPYDLTEKIYAKIGRYIAFNCSPYKPIKSEDKSLRSKKYNINTENDD